MSSESGQQFDGETVEDRADFSAIRYSQSWEDPICLARALDLDPGARVLSIGASGDNSFALLLEDPAEVVALDLSAPQCALIELKREAIRRLDHPDLAAFLGARPHADRWTIYRTKLRDGLPETAQAYWDTQRGAIEQGVIHCGRLERYFRIFRTAILPLVHRRGTVESIFAQRDLEERDRFWHRQFANWRFRLAVRGFFSQTVLGRLGRDPAFFEHVQLPDVAGHYLERTRHAMVEQPVSGNWFLQYITLGRYLDLEATHPYLRPSNLGTLRERLDRLTVVNSSMEAWLGAQADDSVDACNLSDIFEWMDEEAYATLLIELARVTKPGGRLAYWNNLVLRSRPASLADTLVPLTDVAQALHHDDLAFLYRDFVVERIVGAPVPSATGSGG